jgi:hypothetical protein
VFSLLIIRLLFSVVPARSTRTSLTDGNRPLGKKSKRPLGWRTAISSGIYLKGLTRRVRILWPRWIVNIGALGLIVHVRSLFDSWESEPVWRTETEE